MKKNSKQAGFTLIELLVVVAIIGILAAIAIPQYASYKRNAVDAAMKSDLHNAATAAEAYYGKDNNTYQNLSLASLTANGYRQSGNVQLGVSGNTSTDFTLTATANGGNQASFSFKASSGAIQ